MSAVRSRNLPARWATILISSMAGAGAGIGSSWISSEAIEPSSHPPSSQEAFYPADFLPRLDEARPRAVAAREQFPVTDTEEGSDGEESEAASSATAFEDLLDAHSIEMTDPQWSRVGSRDLRSDLEELVKATESALEVVEVDCRSTMCRVGFRWPHYYDALSYQDHLMSYPYQLNCNRHISLPPPESPNEEYEASLILECKDFLAQATSPTAQSR